MDQQNQLEIPAIPVGIQSSQEQYVPSSVEKKKALMMYFLFGIIIVISNKKVNDFEFFHVKQAMWRWMVFILSILVSTIILFIPLIKVVGILWLLIVMGIFIFLAKQAWDGKYYQDVTKYSLGIFPSLWTWLFWLFGISFNDMELNQSIQNQPPQSQPSQPIQDQNNQNKS